MAATLSFIVLQDFILEESDLRIRNPGQNVLFKSDVVLYSVTQGCTLIS